MRVWCALLSSSCKITTYGYQIPQSVKNTRFYCCRSQQDCVLRGDHDRRRSIRRDRLHSDQRWIHEVLLNPSRHPPLHDAHNIMKGLAVCFFMLLFQSTRCESATSVRPDTQFIGRRKRCRARLRRRVSVNGLSLTDTSRGLTSETLFP